MRVSIMLLSDPATSDHDRQALTFLRAAQARGHALDMAFFYHNGALAALNSTMEMRRDWIELCQSSGLRCVVCRTALSRAGHNVDSLPAPFELGGLREWIAAQECSDRVLSFGLCRP